jgi:hypothetical protein
MGYGMYPKTDKLRRFVIDLGHNPKLMKLAITFNANPLTMGDLEEVIANVRQILIAACGICS